MICGNWAFEAILCNKNQNKSEHEYFRRVCSWSYVQFFKNPNILLIFLKKRIPHLASLNGYIDDLWTICSNFVPRQLAYIFFLVHFTCCSKPDKNLHKDNFQKTYSQSFSTTLHILRYYTIHTNVCIVHYKMWFLCKVWFPYQTALEIQRICEDIFNDINTYVFVLWYNK